MNYLSRIAESSKYLVLQNNTKNNQDGCKGHCRCAILQATVNTIQTPDTLHWCRNREKIGIAIYWGDGAENRNSRNVYFIIPITFNYV